MTPTEKPYLSPSALDMFCRCPESWRRRYIEKEIVPPGIAALKGKGLHKGVQGNMQQKIESHEDLSASDIQGMAVAAFEAEMQGGFVLSEEEQSRGKAKVIGEAKDATASMAEFHAVEQAPDYQPILVERKIRIELPMCDHDLLGIIDLADDQSRVTDFKTAGRSKNQNEVDSSVQLTVYAAAFHAHAGQSPSAVRLDTIVSGKRSIKRQLLSSSRGPADFQALANRIDAVSKAIKAGSFTPATPGSWWCSSRFCGYHDRGCPFVNSERKVIAETEDA